MPTFQAEHETQGCLFHHLPNKREEGMPPPPVCWLCSCGLRQTSRRRQWGVGEDSRRMVSRWHQRFLQCLPRVPSGQLPITTVPLSFPSALVNQSTCFPFHWHHRCSDVFALPLSPHAEFNPFSYIHVECAETGRHLYFTSFKTIKIANSLSTHCYMPHVQF